MKNRSYQFKNAEYPIVQNTVLSNLKPYFMKFINENKNNFTNYISVICQIREAGNIYYTIGNRFPIDLTNANDLIKYSDYIQNKWAILDQNKYDPELAISVLFNYTNISVDKYTLVSNKFRIEEIKTQIDIKSMDETVLDLPLNTFYSSWGKNMEMLSNGTIKITDLYSDSKYNLTRYIKVSTLSKSDSLIYLISSESNIVITKFIDKIINDSEFIRQVNDKFYYIRDNKLIFVFENLKCDQFISKAKPAKSMQLKLMTLDVETYVDENNKLNIYCISMYDGTIARSYFLTDYKDTDSLIADVLKNIFVKKYSGTSIYIHNSSKFDMIFLYSAIINHADTFTKPIIKDGKFINLEIQFGNVTKYKVYFKDSYLLLMASLAKLSKAFNVNYTKDIFPHKFVTKNNLNFIGNVPSIDSFYNISIDEYNGYKSRFNNNWCLKSEAIKYCELDCKALYEVISNFSYQFFNKFNVDTNTTPTLPSAAMKTYRTSFYPKDIKIAKISGRMFDHINNAFYGGHVDMYIPANPINTQVFGYDVNSLYPYVMKTFKYPYQYIAHFFGDIYQMNQYYNLLKNCVGYYKVKITAPKDILHPIIPKKVNNTTVYGIGTWVGWYYSEELKNAFKYGYRFEILEGYLFKAADLFSKYVDTMYQIKEQSAKDSPDYMIAKLLQNSLFGKFAMYRELINYAVIDPNYLDKFIEDIGFDNFINKDDIDNKCLVSYNLQFQKDLNINLAIGAAVTANARIYMSNFKNNPNYTLYYPDTDSIYLNKTLPDHLVNNKKLGLFKLECVLDKFVALGPKVYGGIYINGNEFVKTKGLKTKVSVNQLEKLLIENNHLELKHDKNFNNLAQSFITIKSSPYMLRPTDYKRNLIYQNGSLVGTANKDVSDL